MPTRREIKQAICDALSYTYRDQGVYDEIVTRLGYPRWGEDPETPSIDLAEDRAKDYRARMQANARSTKRVIPGAVRIAVFERDEYRCRKCGAQRQLSIDHVVPESRGGPTTLDNLQTLCKPCNSRKGARV